MQKKSLLYEIEKSLKNSLGETLFHYSQIYTVMLRIICFADFQAKFLGF